MKSKLSTFILLLACFAGYFSPAGAISNGVRESSAPSWIAYVTTSSRLFVFQTTESSCTGQVISPTWVLTAAHCVVKENSRGELTRSVLPVRKFSVVLGRVQLKQSIFDGAQFRVDRVLVNPQWNPRKLIGDAALLHLRRSVEGIATAVPLASSLPASSSSIVAFGYGFIRETWSEEAVRNRDIRNYQGTNANYLMATRPGSYSLVSSCTTVATVCLAYRGRSMIRNGDSGGPWLTGRNNVGLFALTSYSEYQVSGGRFVFPRVMATNLTANPMREWIVHTADIYQFRPETIYQPDRFSLAWLSNPNGPAQPIRSQNVLMCLKKKYPVVKVSKFVLTELRRDERSAATCQA